MEVQYTGHPKATVYTTVSPEDLQEIKEIMQTAFLEHLEFGVFDKTTRDILKDGNKARIIRFCEKHEVDWEYPKDRIAFFKAILEDK